MFPITLENCANNCQKHVPFCNFCVLPLFLIEQSWRLLFILLWMFCFRTTERLKLFHFRVWKKRQCNLNNINCFVGYFYIITLHATNYCSLVEIFISHVTACTAHIPWLQWHVSLIALTNHQKYREYDCTRIIPTISRIEISKYIFKLSDPIPLKQLRICMEVERPFANCIDL